MKRFLRASHEEETLVQGIREGDTAALAALFAENRRPVFSFVSKNGGSRDDAEDILQESLIVLWQRIRANRFEPEARLGTFIYATARNLWLRRLARRRRETRTEPASIQSEDPSVFDKLVESEQASMVASAMGRLSEACRKILLAFYWEEKSMEEIAAELGFANAQTAKSKKYQCKKALVEFLR